MGVKHKINRVSKRPEIESVDRMSIGDIMEIKVFDSRPEYKGFHLLNAFGVYVLLEDPRTTWSNSISAKGRILEKGEQLVITIGELQYTNTIRK